MQQVDRTRHIDHVISVVSGIEEVVTPTQMDMITNSWTRCVNEHGLDPTASRPARILEQAQLREHQEQAESFQRVARAGMEQLFKRVSSLGYVVLLTDAEGITVDYIGNDQWDRELKKAGLYVGADWNEKHAGTCGVGTCIYEQEALTCHHGDHFDAAHISLTCTAAPLFDPTGNFMGVLDVSALQSPDAKESQHLTRHLATMYAQLVEDANFIRHFHNHWILRLGTDWAMVNVSGEFMIAFDREGTIVGANHAASKSLKAMPKGIYEPTLIGHQLSDVFKTSFDEIWRLTRFSVTSEKTVLSTLNHELYYAMIIQPRRTAVDNQHAPISTSTDSLDFSPLNTLASDDAKMTRVIEQSKRLVNKSVNILLHGETGTGKEVFARALHESSSRRNKTFVAVNCASIPESLIESELFGYVGGSFSGARSKGARGLILQSDGGTLFLDEIGDMPLNLQSRLLRVLSEREVVPVGGDKSIPLELTVVAASHRDLRRLIMEGTFREDLYYRLCGAVLNLPPLRERTDKQHIISRILEQECTKAEIIASISEEAMGLLLRYRWPGNIRQLRNAVRCALAFCDKGVIEPSDLPQEFFADFKEPSFDEERRKYPALIEPEPISTEPQALVEDIAGGPNQLLNVLRKHHWNITAVSNDLGICRATVYRHMKRHSIVSPKHNG
jgi:sigma-54 dependent transcriptional regulator, acetoin dehydrogenase operon transcriptional activator AcoR